MVTDTVPGSQSNSDTQSVQSTISRFACRIICERNPPFTARIYAAGFDSSKNIFLGVNHCLIYIKTCYIIFRAIKKTFRFWGSFPAKRFLALIIKVLVYLEGSCQSFVAILYVKLSINWWMFLWKILWIGFIMPMPDTLWISACSWELADNHKVGVRAGRLLPDSLQLKNRRSWAEGFLQNSSYIQPDVGLIKQPYPQLSDIIT